MSYSDPNQAEWALQNPATPGEALAAIAQAHPGLRDRVVTHPNAYPQLVTWIAAQSTSAAASASASPQPGAGQPYAPAAGGQPYGAPQQPAPPSYGAPQQPYGMAQQYPGQPSGPGQPYYGPGGYPAGQPPKKKTGLVLGLVGGGAAVVVAVVAVLGIFVFHWFGGSSGSGPTLSKSQVDRFLDSDFMQDLTGDDAGDYYHEFMDPDDVGVVPDGCGAVVDLMANGDQWSSTAQVIRFTGTVSPESFFGAVVDCPEFDVFDAELVEDVVSMFHEQNGGWWASGVERNEIIFVYGNVWLMADDSGTGSSADVKNLFEDFQAAIDTAK